MAYEPESLCLDQQIHVYYILILYEKLKEAQQSEFSTESIRGYSATMT